MNSRQFHQLITTILVCAVALLIGIVWGFNHLGKSIIVNVSSPASSSTSYPVSTRDTIIPLPDNKIGIIDGDPTMGGPFKETIVIFQFDSKHNTFKLVGHYDYSKYMQNPVEYGLLSK
ncbi:MAG: hypothetical protein K6T83_11500 [Alicyclobacillus sp.]|nr:hypothetical protein [Alicyclobacillus sp.]